jgi:hypothetical protein
MVRSAVDPEGVAERRASLDQVVVTAVAALQRWRSSVSAPAIVGSAAADSPTAELRGLAARYERLCAGAQCANPPPAEALAVLQELDRRRAEVSGAPLGVARPAAHVAEEVARCREVLARSARKTGGIDRQRPPRGGPAGRHPARARTSCLILRARSEDKEANVQARVGDRVVVEAKKVGQARRSGEVVRVEGDEGHQRLWVRWDDGHETLFVPSAGVRVQPKESGVTAP